MEYVNIEKELSKSYLEYALSVIIGRAIPDVRDGLKPVHRRILYAMHDLGNTYNRPYKKSARVVGDVIGKYHPHGDSAVYDALVRMAQSFNMRDPLVDGQGNFGSIDGDSAAAMRYTEARMARLTSKFLEDIDKQTVGFRANYDNTLMEPEVLPAKVPNLLVNGSSGIAVGMATNIPPHNLGEVVDATLLLLDRPTATVKELMVHVQGPDFPTGALLFNHRGIIEAYETGRGSVMIRSKVEIKEKKSGTQTIIVKEIPYALNKSTLVEKIAALVNEQKIEGISDLRDESDRTGIRIVIDLKRGANADIVVNQLYKYTQLQTSFGINMMAVVNNRPKLLNLKDVLEYFIAFRKEVVIRRSKFELAKAEHRAHILEGLRVALDNIDEVVSIIRSSGTAAEAKAGLMERFELSDIQSQAILDMRLQRLTGLEREKLLEEYKELLKRIEYLKSVIENTEVLKSVIREELTELKKDFATPRRSALMEYDPREIDIEDIIPDEEVIITMSRQGYIKRASLSIYHQQKKGGKGKAGVNVSEKDFITSILISSNHQNLFFFTNKGRTYQTKVHQIPEGSRIAKGTHIANILPLEQDEYIATILTQRDFEDEKSFLFVTKQGMAKKSLMSLYRNIRSSGIIAVGLKEKDELLAVREIGEQEEVILITREGYAIRFASADIRNIGRAAHGVKGITLRSNDEVVTGVVVNGDGKKELLTIAENGLGKRTLVDQYRTQSRGGKGIINMRVTPRTGKVVGAMMVDDEDEIILLTSGHKIIRIGIAEVSLVGRATQGVKLVQLDDDQKVVCFDRVVSGEGLAAERKEESDSQEETSS